MPTVTKSIGTTGRDYSTITLWEADLDNTTPYDAGDTAVGECYDDSAFDEIVTINGGGTIGLAAVKLSVAVGERHTGVEGTGARIVRTATGTIITTVPLAGTQTLIVEWLEIDGNGQTIDNAINNTNATAGRVPVLQRLIIHGTITGNANQAAIRAELRDALVQNCIVYDCGTTVNARPARGIWVDADQPGGGCLNNTVHNIHSTGTTSNATGIIAVTDDVDARIRNNISMGQSAPSSTAIDFSFPGTTNLTSSNNLSSDATADDGGGANHLINKTTANQFVSTVGGSEDYHLKAGADAIDAGVDLATTPTGVNFDIDGYDRDATAVVWDIGADERVSAGGAVSQTHQVPVSWLSRITDVDTLHDTWQAGISPSHVIPEDWLTSASLNQELPETWKGSVSKSQELPLNWQAGLSPLSTVPLSWQTTLSLLQVLDATWRADLSQLNILPINWFQASGFAAHQTPITWLQGISIADNINVSWGGAALILATHGIPISWRSELSLQQALSLSWKLDISNANQLAIAWLEGVLRGNATSVSWLANLSASSVLSFHWKLDTQKLNELTLEWLAVIRQTGEMPLNWIGRASIAAQGIIPITWGGLEFEPTENIWHLRRKENVWYLKD